MRKSAILLLMGLMAGCSSVLPSGLMRLQALSPLEANPEGFVVTLDLPQGIAIIPGSATLTLEATQTEREQATSGSFILDEGRDAEGGQTYRIAPRDLERFRTLQMRINTWETEDPDATTGSLSVRIGACRLGDGPGPDATVSVALQTAVGETAFPLLRDAPLSRILDRAETGDIGPCN